MVKIQSHKHDGLSVTQYRATYFMMSASQTNTLRQSLKHVGLPVLANISPSNLRRTSAVDKMLSKIQSHQHWPVHANVLNHTPPRLSSRHPIWSDLSPVDMTTQWKENWQSASVTNHAIVVDSTTRQPDFDLFRCLRSL